MKKLKTEKINYRLINTIFIGILAAFAIWWGLRYAYSFPTVRNAVTLATTVQPETFTELYFENHSTLPNTITKQKEYSFTFTLHNVEYRTMDYPYAVYVQRGIEKIPIERGSVNMASGETKSVTVEFGPLKNLRSEIVVNLTDKNQQIDFWMEPI